MAAGYRISGRRAAQNAGIAFPQEDLLNEHSGKEFFESQSYTGVAENGGTIVGLYILHPNNVGKCGHICKGASAQVGLKLIFLFWKSSFIHNTHVKNSSP